MTFRQIFSFVAVLFALEGHTQPCREVIAYFPSWKWYNRQQFVNPSSIDYSKYTIINYAFFQPEQDGRISPFDPRTDKTLLLGNFWPEAPESYRMSKEYGRPFWHDASTSLVQKAQGQGVKVMISIGGWTLSEHFSAIAAHPEKRRRFAQSCNEMVRVYDIDGIDLDWEYPGFRGNGGSAADRQNFTLLLREIRDSLDVLQFQSEKKLLLTAAFGVSPERMRDIEWSQTAHLLDYINLMTYDFYGTDFSVTNHHAPLFSPARGINGYDLHSVVHHLMKQYDVPPGKINIGVAFYGRSMKTLGLPGLHVASGKKPDTATFPEDAGAPMFYNIINRLQQFHYRWDSLAQAPYLQGKNSNTFVTFDDERSVAKKAKYILDHNLAGAIIWDITGDYLQNRYRPDLPAWTPLANTLKAVLCGFGFPETFIDTDLSSEIPTPIPQRWPYLKSKRFAPRVLSSIRPLSKKELRKARKKERQHKRLVKQKNIPDKYFDGGH
jgi:chitinase